MYKRQLWIVAPLFLPERKPPLADRSPRVFNATFHIHDTSAACGLTFAESLSLTDNEMRVDRIERGEGLTVTKLPSVRITAGDRLVVRDTPEQLKHFEKQLGATLHGDLGENKPPNNVKKFKDQQYLAEIVVTRGSLLHRASLIGVRFAQRTGLLPLAIHRARAPGGEEISGHTGTERLRAGDVVLVQGTDAELEKVKRSGTTLLLDGTTDLPRTHRAGRALIIMVVVVLFAATGILPISVSAVVGVGAMLATRCLTWEEAAGALSSQVIMIIVASLALGLAMTETSGALYLAQTFVEGVRLLPTPFILSSLILIMAIITNVVSNAAAGIIGTPIALSLIHI